MYPRPSLSGVTPSGPSGSRRNQRERPQTYPSLEPEDIDEALRCAAYLAEEETGDVHDNINIFTGSLLPHTARHAGDEIYIFMDVP